MAKNPLLIGDIGGTNARFAWVESGKPALHDALTLQCSDFASANDAIRHYLQASSTTTPRVACIAAAGPVVDGVVRVTNNHWTLAAADIETEFAIRTVRLLNDFEAVAYSIPQLRSRDMLAVGRPDRTPVLEGDFDIAILGPGTGLGAAGLAARGQCVVPTVGEGGHVGFAPETARQVEILHELQGRFDRVSIERLLSGPGVENIYWAISRLGGEQRTQLNAPEIFDEGCSNGDPCAVEAVAVFFQILGQVAGDLALTLGTSTGVYIAGGIVRRYPKLLQDSGFREAFDNKGPHRSRMESIPTLLITHQDPGLLGAAGCVQEIYSTG